MSQERNILFCFGGSHDLIDDNAKYYNVFSELNQNVLFNKTTNGKYDVIHETG